MQTRSDSTPTRELEQSPAPADRARVYEALMHIRRRKARA